MHSLIFWRAFAQALCRTFDAVLDLMRAPPDIRETAAGAPALVRRSFRNAFAACWDMLAGHPGNRVLERWELDG